MKKRYLAVTLVIAFVLSLLSGCGRRTGQTSTSLPGGSDAAATTDTYPSKPITIIAPANPGGGYDSLARAVASMSGAYLGQVTVVENVPGASYTLGAAQAINSNPDGYTLVLCTNKQFSTTPLSIEVEYEPLEGVEYFGSMAEVRWVWGVNSGLYGKLGVPDAAGFLEYVKAHPGEIIAGSISVSTALMYSQLASAGYEFSVVSYPDAATLAVAIANGEVDTGISAATAQTALRESGDIEFVMELPGSADDPIAEGVAAATVDFPEIANALGSSMYQWYGLFGPKGMPQETIDTINQFISDIAKDDSMIALVKKIGMTPAYHTAADMKEAVKSEYKEVEAFYAANPQG